MASRVQVLPKALETEREVNPLTLPKLTFRFSDVRDGKFLADTANQLMQGLHRLSETLKSKFELLQTFAYQSFELGEARDVEDGGIADVLTFDANVQDGVWKLTWYAELSEDGLGGELLVGMYVDGSRKVAEMSWASTLDAYDGVFSGVWLGTLAAGSSVIRMTAGYDAGASGGTEASLRNCRFLLERVQ